MLQYNDIYNDFFLFYRILKRYYLTLLYTQIFIKLSDIYEFKMIHISVHKFTNLYYISWLIGIIRWRTPGHY